MKYLDPYDFFQLSGPGAIDADSLRKLRRRTAADFELSTDGTLDWQGRIVARTEAMDLLDALEDADHRKWYWEMRTVRGLLAYLKGDSPKAIAQVDFRPLQKDPALHAFCSRFLRSCYTAQLTKAIENTEHWHEAALLLKYATVVSLDQLEVTLQPCTRLFHGYLIALEEMVNTHSIDDFEPQTHAAIGLMNVLNQFPPTYQHLRNNYGLALMQLARQHFARPEKLQMAFSAITAACVLVKDPANNKAALALRLKIVEAQNRQRRNDERSNPTTKVGLRPGQLTNLIPCFVLPAIGVLLILFYSFIYHRRHAAEDLQSMKEVEQMKAEIEAIQRNAAVQEAIDVLTAKPQMPTLIEALREIATYSPFEARFKPRSAQPADGFAPYHHPAQADEKNDHKKLAGNWRFQNDSDKDAVLLLFDGPRSEVVTSCYVRAKSKCACKPYLSGRYSFYIYNGSDWMDDLTDVDGKVIGGFVHDVDYVGNYFIDSRFSDAPQLFAAIGQDAADGWIVFDGKTLEWVP